MPRQPRGGRRGRPSCRHVARSNSGYKGVYRDKAGKFQACVKQGGWKEYLGSFATAEEAACAYDAKAIELFGEFARLNFPPEVALTTPKGEQPNEV